MADLDGLADTRGRTLQVTQAREGAQAPLDLGAGYVHSAGLHIGEVEPPKGQAASS